MRRPRNLLNAHVRRVVRPPDCEAGGGGRLPGGHHPQTHDGTARGHHAARLTRRAMWMERPLSRRRRSADLAGGQASPAEDRSIDSHEETASADKGKL